MAIHVTLRDVQILEALHTSRYLTSPQIQALFWRESRGGTWGRQKACARRLRQLTAAGLVRRVEQPVRRADPSLPYVYCLARRGADVLVAELGFEPQDVDWRPKPAEENYPFLQHLLATTDFRIALLAACARNRLELVEWVDERELKSEGMKDYVTLDNPGGRRQRAAVVPDAFFMLRETPARGTKSARCFLEVDRRNLTVAPSAAERRGWTRKIRTYLAYFDSAAYRERYGNHTVRVLTVTTGDLRLHNLKQATESVGGGARFWFTTFERATAEWVLSQPIWQVAGVERRFSLLE